MNIGRKPLNLSYFIEVVILFFVLQTGMQFIDKYFYYQNIKSEFNIKSDLQYTAVELSVEVLSAMNSSVHHYDKYAQKQLKFERLFHEVKLLGVVEGRESLIKSLDYFLDHVTSYMQYATMLKTSFRFVSTMELNKQSLNQQQDTRISNIIALIAAYQLSLIHI